MTPARFHKIKTVLQQRQPTLTLVTDGVHKTQNLSAILRTADAVGLDKIHVAMPDRDQYQPHRRTSAGAGRWVDVEIHSETALAVQSLKQQGFKICVAHMSEQSANYRGYDFCQPTAIVLGAEKPGVSSSVASMADQHLFVPMHGMVESYNVSVAAAIILGEAMQQRIENGLYNRTQLDPKTFTQKMFRWCYPKLADFCDLNNIPYPALDEVGGIIYSDQWTIHAKQFHQDN